MILNPALTLTHPQTEPRIPLMTVFQTLTIPRAVTLIAGGQPKASPHETLLEFEASKGHPDWNIIDNTLRGED